MNFFGIDGVFSRIGTKVFDFSLIIFLWITISFLGLGITFGASTTAFYYTVDKTIIHDEGYVLKNFFKSFKLNFLKATFIWVILCVCFFIIRWNLNFIENIKTREFPTIIVVFQYIVLIELFFLYIYVFPLLSKFETTIKEVIIKSIIIAHSNFLITIISTSIIVIFGLLANYVSNIFIFVGIVVWSYAHSKLVMGKVLPRYYS